MALIAADNVFINPVGSAAYDAWPGDDIGFATDRPARICLGASSASEWTRPLEAHFSLPMVCRAWSQLCGKANVGELHPDDVAAWCEAEDECPVSARAVESL
jgi:hypothetical protein